MPIELFHGTHKLLRIHKRHRPASAQPSKCSTENGNCFGTSMDFGPLSCFHPEPYTFGGTNSTIQATKMNYHPNHYKSIRQFMETQQQSNQSDSDAAGNVSVLINLMDPDDETVDHTRLTHQEITALRTSDPFTYFSIMVAQQGTSSYCDLDSLTEEPQTAGAAGHADAGAGGVQVRSNGAVYDRNENHSFHGGAPLRTNIRQRIMRRSSMPNLAASTIQDNHHVPTSNEVKRRRRFATETDACTALLHLARLENVDLLV